MTYPVVGLRIEPELVEQMKIRAIRERRSVLAITEELWREYLQKKPKSLAQQMREVTTEDIRRAFKRVDAERGRR